MNIKIGKAAKTVLLLHMNGANGSQSFVDSSINNCSVSAFDNAQISTAQSKFGGASAVFDDSGSYLEIASRPDFGFGTGDFTIEMWLYKSSPITYWNGFFGINRFDNNGILIRLQPNGGANDALYVGGNYYNWDAPTNFPLNQWNHFALVRHNGVIVIYVNGNSVFSANNSNNLGSVGEVTVGASAHSFVEGFDGYIDELRIIKGAGIYTSNFTPPTSEFPSTASLSITKGGSGKTNQKKYIDLLPSSSNLTFLFDPIFYNNIKEESGTVFSRGRISDPFYLSHSIRDYQYNNIVPQLSNVDALQYIKGKPLGTKKSGFKNNVFSWIKDISSDNDLENGRNDKSIGGGMAYEDLRVPLLTLTKPGNTDLFSNSTTSTFIFFIRLQNPITHKNPNNPEFLVREKRGFFTKIGNLEIGYRSPYYNIVGEPSYKSVFNNFSFVFNFGSGSYIEIHNSTFMTDFKFNFNQMYCIAIVKNNFEMKFYINGELQNMAYLKFNPLTNNPHCGLGGRPRRLFRSRKSDAPVGPGFKKTDGSVYNPTNIGGLTPISTNHSINCAFGGSNIIHGKSNLSRYSHNFGVKRSKRYLNNLDIGVNIAYSIALSQSQINQIYENFRSRY